MPATMELPTTIPIFALPNVVLFPGVPLPLHIFEPRYRDMVRDAIKGDGIIGMALLRGDWQHHYEDQPDIFEIGCAGKVASCEEMPDGKFNILLHGLREFSIQTHRYEKAYREADIIWRSPGPQQLAATTRALLELQLSRYLSTAPDSAAQRLLRDESLTDAMLVNFFSYSLEIDALEKQGLLQATSLEQRAQGLAELLEFHLEEERINVPIPDSDRCH